MATDDKKYFDVAPPSAPAVPTVKPGNRRMMKKNDDGQKVDVKYSDVSFDPTKPGGEEALLEDGQDKTEDIPVLYPDFKVVPKEDTAQPAAETEKNTAEDNKTKKIEQPVDIPRVDPLTKPNTDKVDKDDQADGQQPADSKNETDSPTKAKVNKDDATEKAQDQDKESLPKERFAATDALPDPGQKAAEEAKNNMQDPKPFDTKEYYVPIGNTHHKHGSVKAAMAFGVLCAVLAVAAALYYLYHISM